MFIVSYVVVKCRSVDVQLFTIGVYSTSGEAYSALAQRLIDNDLPFAEPNDDDYDEIAVNDEIRNDIAKHNIDKSAMELWMNNLYERPHYGFVVEYDVVECDKHKYDQ